MKLIYSAASPYARKVVVLAHEIGIADKIELLDFRSPRVTGNPEIKTANPLGKFPALILEDGSAVFDSRVICTFLDAHFKGGMYPESDPWGTMTLEAMAEGIMDASVLLSYERRKRPPELRDAERCNDLWAKISDAAAALNERFLYKLQGPTNMAHIAVGCSLGFLDFRHSEYDWRAGNSNIADWYQSFSTRPSMVETTPRQ